ncbi:MAG: hypothetical protein ACF8MJ_04395 [Phycisphaerales bacterium JB050]
MFTAMSTDSSVAAVLSPRPPQFPPHRAPGLRLLGALGACAATVLSVGCSPVPPEAAQLALASSSAVDTLRDEHAALVRAVSATRRAEIDTRFEAIYADAEGAVRTRHGLSPTDPLTLEHRLDIAAITLSARDELLAAIAQTESDLLARTELHHAHARRMTDALGAYLLARTDADQLRAALAQAAAARLGIDADSVDSLLDPSAALDELLNEPR